VEAQRFLDNVLRKFAVQWPSCGGVVTPRIESFVRARTAQTIRKWYTVEDDPLDKSDPLREWDVERWSDQWRSKADI